MEIIKISYHSFIDMITNSSTMVYVECHAKTKEFLFEFIDSLLKIAGSNKKAEDLFVVKIKRDCFYNYNTDTELYDVDIEFDRDGNRTDDYQDDDNFEDHVLFLIPKDSTQEVINIMKSIKKIFNIEASYDG